MRYLMLATVLLLTACGGQGRYVYEPDPEPRDPEPRPRDVPLEETADAFVRRAHRAESREDYDEARTEYHHAFRRERWHFEANSGYQNLMRQVGLSDVVWREYLDLWQQHATRGDAWWWHLGHAIKQRHETGNLQSEPMPKATPEDKQRIDSLREQAIEAMQARDFAAAIVHLDQALQLADLYDLHRLRIAAWPESDLDTLVQQYAEHAEENPASGNRAALHAAAKGRQNPLAALKLLREAVVLEIPGEFLWLELATQALGMAQQIDANANQDATRQAAGWYLLAAEAATAARYLLPESEEVARLTKESEAGWRELANRLR